MDEFETRFGGIARLYGVAGLQRLRAAHVAVVGIGGVGVWTVEALARSGVGALTLVDLDEICTTNINRQLHALTETVGRAKVEAMAERVRSINPDCRVHLRQTFLSAENAAEILATDFNFVFDAIDSVTDKVALLAACRAKKLRVISAGAAGGRRVATLVRVADLAGVSHDRLLGEVRRRLRRDCGLPAAGSAMGIDCVFSTEAPVFGRPDGSVCPTRAELEPGTRLNCNEGLGSATFVTGAFGFAAAGWIVQKIAEA
jgi:tRNA A37 threonylcarbamoyladenosine dehydratase